MSSLLRAEAAKWTEARQGLQPPLVVAKRLVPIPFIMCTLLNAVSGSSPPWDFPLASRTALMAMAFGLFFPASLLFNLDGALDDRAWAWLGALQKHKRCTSEPERPGALVLHPMNTYSSHAQTAAGLFILARACGDARARIASGAFGLTLIAMGIASHVWWASRRDAAQRIDSWLMETVTAAMGISMLSLALPAWEVWLVCAWAIAAAWRASSFAAGKAMHANLLAPTLVYTSGYVFAVLRLGGCGHIWRYAAGTGWIYAGLVLKMFDTSRIGEWGTAAFHYAAGLGFALLWLWSQTLPAPSEP